MAWCRQALTLLRPAAPYRAYRDDDEPDPLQHEIWQKMRQRILRGRVLNGEPGDFDY